MCLKQNQQLKNLRTMNWKDLSSAPAKGTFVAKMKDVPEGVTTLDVRSQAGAFPMILAHQAGQFYAYVNACPHQYLPLNYRGSQILSAKGDQLMCTSHGAMYDLESGIGTAGHGLGCALDSVPLEITKGGQILIG